MKQIAAFSVFLLTRLDSGSHLLLTVECNRSKGHVGLPLSLDDLTIRQAVPSFSGWSREMVALLRNLVNRLGNTVDAWDRFQRKYMGYFLFDDENPTASSILEQSVNAVDTVFLDLKDILKKLRTLEAELLRDSPQGVSYLPHHLVSNNG
jgi:hypothetical protein